MIDSYGQEILYSHRLDSFRTVNVFGSSKASSAYYANALCQPCLSLTSKLDNGWVRKVYGVIQITFLLGM